MNATRESKQDRRSAQQVLEDIRARELAAAERRIERDKEYRRALGVSLTEPLPRTLGKAEGMGRPLFAHDYGTGARHALGRFFSYGEEAFTS